MSCVKLFKIKQFKIFCCNFMFIGPSIILIQGGSNATGTDSYVNKPHCAAAVRP